MTTNCLSVRDGRVIGLPEDIEVFFFGLLLGDEYAGLAVPKLFSGYLTDNGNDWNHLEVRLIFGASDDLKMIKISHGEKEVNTDRWFAKTHGGLSIRRRDSKYFFSDERGEDEFFQIIKPFH